MAEEDMDNICDVCGQIVPNGRRACPRCGERNRITAGSSPPRMKRRPIAVALAFFIPGLGHIYAGEDSKGVILIMTAVLLGALPYYLLWWTLKETDVTGISTVISAMISIAFLPYFILWIYGMLDGSRAVLRQNFPEEAHDE